MKLFDDLDVSKIKIKWLNPHKIQKVDSLPKSTLKMLTASIPALKDGSVLTEDAIRLIALMHPPIVSQPHSKEQSYVVVGNLRTIEICRWLPSDARVPVIVASLSMTATGETDFQKLTTFLSSVSFGLDAARAENGLLSQIQELSGEMLQAVSPEFATRSGLERCLGLNRRRAAPQRRYARSPTSEPSLKRDEEGGDV